MLRTSKLLRAAVTVVGAGWGVISTPAAAAMSLSDIDWRSYLQLSAYTDWHALLLVGSIGLLVGALMVKAVRMNKSEREVEAIDTGDRYTRRIGTMPIYPPVPMEAH